MTLGCAFETIVVADWSAANAPTPARPSKDAIWLCIDRGGAREVIYLRTRAEALARIDAVLDEGRRTLLGFDVAFGAPEGLAAHLTGEARALALWDWLAARVEDGPANRSNRFEVAAAINATLPGTGPFWGRPAHLDLPGLPATRREVGGHGLPERRAVEARVPGAKPLWQAAYAGAVGSQSILGMAALAALRRRDGVAVWPQETGFAVPSARIVLAEVYPSLFPPDPHPIRDAGQVTATTRALRAAPDDWWRAASSVPDAERIAAEEGWILGVGPDGPLPPPRDAVRFTSDCFALPPDKHWTPVDEALDALRLSCACAVGPEEVTLDGAAGRILAADLISTRANPPAANSAVDGWGYADSTVAAGLMPRVAGRAAAGSPFSGTVPPGHVVRVLTGAELPCGVDTVTLQEDATETDGGVTLHALPRPGANTRAAGEDIRAGDVVLEAGTVLRPTDLALAATAGHGRLTVRARLRVGVLSTGDEIAAPGASEGLPDANRPMLLAMLAGWGLEAIDLGQVPDDRPALARRLDTAVGDVAAIVTSGGASDGAEDHLSALMRERGQVAHWRIALKPGRPLMLGRWGGVPVFGLPGNPVAAFTCAALFARPALLQMAGAGWRAPEGVELPAAFAKRRKSGRAEALRARLRDGRVEVYASEGSGRVAGLSWAEGLVWLPDGGPDVAPGDPVRFWSFPELGIG